MILWNVFLLQFGKNDSMEFLSVTIWELIVSSGTPAQQQEWNFGPAKVKIAI